jgi:hypothetical protein
MATAEERKKFMLDNVKQIDFSHDSKNSECLITWETADWIGSNYGENLIEALNSSIAAADCYSIHPNLPQNPIVNEEGVWARCDMCEFSRPSCPGICVCVAKNTHVISNRQCHLFRGEIPLPIKIVVIDGEEVVVAPGDDNYSEV